MKLLLGILFLVIVGLVAAVAFAYRWLKRSLSARASRELLESFDQGLAIPMRDTDTRRTSNKLS